MTNQIEKRAWVKNLLNNLTLLKWVRKFSADYLCDDNTLAEKFGVKSNEESISVGDKTMTKLLITQAKYVGEEYVRYNVEQLKDAIDLVGKKGELIVPVNETPTSRALVIKADDTIVIVSPLPPTDKPKDDKERA